MQDWEIIADNLKGAGFSLGWVSALDIEGRTIWIVDAKRAGKWNRRAVWRNAETHTVEITGKTDSHALDIELKK